MVVIEINPLAPYPSHLMRRVSRYLPPLVLMGVIYFLSDQPGLKSGLGVADLIGRKLIHAGTFGLLFVLWLRAYRAEPGGREDRVMWSLLPVDWPAP